MRGFLAILLLELKSLARSKTLAMLVAAAVVWMLAAPHLVVGDGTREGARELYIRFSLGGVFAMLAVSLLASATGALASERDAKRLQLTMVRPVGGFTVALAKIAAHTAAGALVMAVACGVLALNADLSRGCFRVLSPVLPSPRQEAETMYEEYMKDPQTPAAVKKAGRGTVLRLLENRAADHYQTVATNSSAAWRFRLDGKARATAPTVRLRLTNQYEMRQTVAGKFRLGGYGGTVSNMTQAVVTVPLAGGGPAADELVFANLGAGAVMLRPRKDVKLLSPEDSFGWNLARAYLELVSVLAFLVSFGVFLSAGLGRPVAMFTAFVALTVSEISPSVTEQYPDELETDLADRIGLVITRSAAGLAKPVSSATPLSALSADEYVEGAVRLAVVDMAVAPLVMALLAGLVLPRREVGL